MDKASTQGAQNTEDVPEMIVNTAPRILMIVTNKDSLDANKEAKLKTMLQNTYNAVVEVAQSDTDVDLGNWDLKRYDLIIVFNGVAPADVNNLKTAEVPVLSLDEDVSVTALNMAATGGNSASETQTNATDITHQITSEALRDIDPTSIATGNKTVYSTASGIDFITTLGASGVSLTEDIVTATEEHIVVYDEGATLQDATVAEEIRIHFGLYQYDKLNSTGRALLKHAINYAIYGPMMSPLVSIETDIEYIKDNMMTTTIADYNQNFGIRVGGFLPQGQELGDAFYADASVSSSGAGTSWSVAVKTIAELDALMTDDNGDYGFIAHGTYDENASVNGASITKAHCHYVTPATAGAVQVSNSNGSAIAIFTISVNGDNVELAGFRSAEATTTVEFCVCSAAEGLYFHDNVLYGAMENGLHITATNYCVIEHNIFAGMTNDGVEIDGNALVNRIRYNEFVYILDNAIHLNGDAVDQNFVYKNEIDGGAGTTDYAITVTLGDANYIDWNSMGQLGTWPIFNSGSNNYWGPHNGADSISGTYNRTVANSTTLIATNVTNIDLWASGKYEFQWDLSTLVTAGEGGNVDGYIYSKVITTFIKRDLDRMVIGTDVLHPTCEKGFVGGDSQLQEGLQCSVAVTANRLVGWRLVKIS